MLIDGTARILHDEDELVGLYCGDTFFWPDPWIDRWDAGDLFTWDSLWYDKWSGTFHYVIDAVVAVSPVPTALSVSTPAITALSSISATCTAGTVSSTVHIPTPVITALSTATGYSNVYSSDY